MSTRLLIGQNGGSKVYAIGRVGFDDGSADAGGTYSGRLRTDPLSPSGEGGLNHFRRLLLRIRHTGSFVCTVRCYVDGVQTKVWSSGSQVNQAVTFTQAAPTFYPTDSEAETLLEVDLDAQGTFLVAELDVESDAITGVFLIESVWIGYRTVKLGRQRTASAT